MSLLKDIQIFIADNPGYPAETRPEITLLNG